MGFTAINAKPATESSAQPSHNARSLAMGGAREGQPRNNSIASEYLGRGEERGPIISDGLDSGKVSGSSAKKSSGKGKKRASTAKPKSSTKRRKATDISDNLVVTKLRDEVKPATKASRPKVSKGTSSMSGIGGGGIPFQDATMLHGITANVDIIHPSISTYAPSTSMDSLKGTQTSLDAVRCSKGPSTTIYTGNPNESVARTVLGVPKLPSNGSESYSLVVSGTSSAVHEMALRPRKKSVVKNVKGGASSSSITLQDSVKPNEENFINDDDDFAELAELVEAVPNITTSSWNNVRSFAEEGPQLPTPVNSGGIAEPPDATLETQHGSSAANSDHEEEFTAHFDDEEAAEVTKLTSLADETASESDSRPRREKSMNMREVDRHEDYGGALLTDSERQLLGMIPTIAYTQLISFLYIFFAV